MTRSDWISVDDQPIASGNQSLVYWHPQDDGKLIKIPRALNTARDMPRTGLARSLCKMKQRQRFNIGNRRQRAAIRAYEASGRFCPIPLCFGTVQTRLGEGQVIEAITDADGKLGPTLRDLMHDDRLEPEHRSAVLHLMESAFAHNLFIADLKLHNLVWGTARGRTSLFIVDGFDDHALFRPVGWFPERDRRSMQARWQDHILGPLGLSPEGRGHAPSTIAPTAAP